jgi:hypothetical protein
MSTILNVFLDSERTPWMRNKAIGRYHHTTLQKDEENISMLLSGFESPITVFRWLPVTIARRATCNPCVLGCLHCTPFCRSYGVRTRVPTVRAHSAPHALRHFGDIYRCSFLPPPYSPPPIFNVLFLIFILLFPWCFLPILLSLIFFPTSPFTPFCSCLYFLFSSPPDFPHPFP